MSGAVGVIVMYVEEVVAITQLTVPEVVAAVVRQARTLGERYDSNRLLAAMVEKCHGKQRGRKPVTGSMHKAVVGRWSGVGSEVRAHVCSLRMIIKAVSAGFRTEELSRSSCPRVCVRRHPV